MPSKSETREQRECFRRVCRCRAYRPANAFDEECLYSTSHNSNPNRLHLGGGSDSSRTLTRSCRRPAPADVKRRGCSPPRDKQPARSADIVRRGVIVGVAAAADVEDCGHRRDSRRHKTARVGMPVGYGCGFKASRRRKAEPRGKYAAQLPRCWHWPQPWGARRRPCPACVPEGTQG
jgi:hypothetical protein